jgi:hypothetical protein
MVISQALQLLLAYLLLLASLLYLVLLLLLASLMFPLVDPDVVDILAAVGVPGLHAHASLPDTDGFPTFAGVLAVAGFLFLVTLPCCPHFVGVVRYLLSSSFCLRLWNLLSWCCWRPCCFWLSAFAAFTMMLVPSFCWWHPFCCWLAPPKLFFFDELPRVWD